MIDGFGELLAFLKELTDASQTPYVSFDVREKAEKLLQKMQKSVALKEEQAYNDYINNGEM
jgi:hypothetical protein